MLSINWEVLNSAFLVGHCIVFGCILCLLHGLFLCVVKAVSCLANTGVKHVPVSEQSSDVRDGQLNYHAYHLRSLSTHDGLHKGVDCVANVVFVVCIVSSHILHNLSASKDVALLHLRLSSCLILPLSLLLCSLSLLPLLSGLIHGSLLLRYHGLNVCTSAQGS